jgi:hypothetical protein
MANKSSVPRSGGSLKRMVRRWRLFLRLVWREWEPASCGIPDEYRIHYRIPVREAWRIASDVHAQNARVELQRPPGSLLAPTNCSTLPPATNQPTKGETMNNMKFVKAHGGYYQWVSESDPRPEWRPALIRLLNAVVERWGWVVTRRRE